MLKGVFRKDFEGAYRLLEELSLEVDEAEGTLLRRSQTRLVR